MNSLNDYGDLFERLGLTELSVKEGDFELTLKKKADISEAVVVRENAEETPQKNNNVIRIDGGKTNPKGQSKQGTEVKAPLLGIFYGKVGEKEPVKVGDKVKKGDCLCTIEAMKMLNEVLSPIDGEIVEISAKDGELVEYNQMLFVVA